MAHLKTKLNWVLFRNKIIVFKSTAANIVIAINGEKVRERETEKQGRRKKRSI